MNEVTEHEVGSGTVHGRPGLFVVVPGLSRTRCTGLAHVLNFETDKQALKSGKPKASLLSDRRFCRVQETAAVAFLTPDE
jgi:hypothetical protein